MPEETEAAQPQEGKKRSMMRLIVPVVVILIAAGLGFATFRFVLAPMLAEAPAERDEGSERILPTVTTVTFDQSIATVIMPEGSNIPASLLMFQISLECANEATALLIEAHKSRFNHMLNELHQFQKRKDLDDPLVKKSIEKRAMQKANDLLKQLQEKPDPEIRVTAVFHDRWLVQDQL